MTLASCDDKDHPEAPRLFSPVVSTSVNANSIVCTWQGIKEATRYELTLQRALPNPNEDGSVAVQDIKSVTVNVDPTGQNPYSPFTFENLDWDERYRVCIKAVGETKESRIYNSEFTTLTYPTKLRSVSNTIDSAAKIEWNEGDDVDIAYMNVFVRNADGTLTPWVHETSAPEEEETRADEEVAYYYTVTDKDLKASYAIIEQLKPETDFRVIAYSADGEYRGRRDFTTKAAEVFENPELVVDLRQKDTTILDGDLFNSLPDNAILLLKGGVDYTVDKTPKFTKSFTMRTGMSLLGKANVMCGGFAVAGDVANIRIENIRYTCLPTDDKTSNFGGRYFFNNSDVYNVGNLVFEDVEIVAMRGIIRTRKKAQHFDNIVFNNCILDSIGGYKVVQLDTDDTSVGTITITNSTLSHIDGVIRANNRKNTNIDQILIDNCTFAYASNNAPLFMLKKDGCCEGLKFDMNNCVIGGNYFGKAGQGATFNASATAAYNNVFVAGDYNWAVDAEGNITSPLGSYTTMKEGIKDIWVDPANGNFTYKSGKLDCAEVGDPRWRVAK